MTRGTGGRREARAALVVSRFALLSRSGDHRASSFSLLRSRYTLSSNWHRDVLPLHFELRHGYQLALREKTKKLVDITSFTASLTSCHFGTGKKKERGQYRHCTGECLYERPSSNKKKEVLSFNFKKESKTFSFFEESTIVAEGR